MFLKTMRTAVLILLGCLGAATHCEAQEVAAGAAWVRAHYTKYEYRIPMRDGVKLFTAVYVPKDASHSYPFLMERTPYNVGPYGEDQFPESLGPSDAFLKSGYIFVFQDVRGRYMSGGTFIEMRPHLDDKKSPKDVDDSSDMHDTVDFLLSHVSNNNGNVGIWGISYPGFYTLASIIDSHPAIKAASPQAPMTDLFKGDDGYHGGAFMLDGNANYYATFRPFPEPDSHEKSFFDLGGNDLYQVMLDAGSVSDYERKYFNGGNWQLLDQIHHDTYDDYWKARNITAHLHNIHAAVLTVGGWFDAEDVTGPFRAYKNIKLSSPETDNRLVIGPWVHSGWARTHGDRLGDTQFGSNTTDFYQANIQFPFFEHYLKGAPLDLPKVYAFETGTNVWRKYPDWPPAEATSTMLYLQANGRLSFEKPTGDKTRDGGSDSYLSDPAHPVPFVDYMPSTVPWRYMSDDQRFAARRPDVLTYETAPLEEDVTVAGPMVSHLVVSSTGTDSDFDVKLIDVYPEDTPDVDTDGELGKWIMNRPRIRMGGYEQLVRGQPMRAKFHESWEHPVALVPDEPTKLDFEMPDINHSFRRGHRIMVQIQSSWFPLTDRNPQTFVDIPNAKAQDFKKATETVYRSAQYPSSIELPVLPNAGR